LFGKTLFDCLVDDRRVGRLAQSLLAAQARRHLTHLDRQRPDRIQLHTLQRLLRRAQRTPFGQAHDFERIRRLDDFRRLVPLREPADIRLALERPGQTCPPSSLLVESGETTEPLPINWLTTGLQTAHRRLHQIALAFVLHARPKASLLPEGIAWLGDGTRLIGRPPCSSASLAAQRFDWLIRPWLHANPDWHFPEWDCSTRRSRSFVAPHLLIGPANRLVQEADQYPAPVAVLASRSNSTPSCEAVQRHFSRSLILEMLIRPEGPLAIEDPRFGSLRLLPGLGLFFEFLPLDRPTRSRLTLGEVRCQEPYELALTSPSGVWACRTGLHLEFCSVQPHLIRLLAASVQNLAPVASQPASPATERRIPGRALRYGTTDIPAPLGRG
jgi:hypothetical protein